MSVMTRIRVNRLIENLKRMRNVFILILAPIIIFSGANFFFSSVVYFENASDSLIVDSLKRSQEAGRDEPFMQRKDLRLTQDYAPYYSQFGLTYRVLQPFSRYVNNYRLLSSVLSIVNAVCTALVLGSFSVYLLKLYSFDASITFLTLCSFTPTFLLFSGSFYWQLPLLMLPTLVFYIGCVGYPLFSVALVFLILLIRFLGGYEYATTLILSPVAALFVRYAFGDLSIKQVIPQAVMAVVAGLAAFVFAILIHLLAMHSALNSWSATFHAFFDVVLYRTGGDYFSRPVTLKGDLIALSVSFFQNEFFLTIGIALFALVLSSRTFGRTTSVKLGLALAFSLLCGFSWQLLARGHMRDHAHLNFIVYLIPFGILTYISISRVIHELFSVGVLGRRG